MNLARRVAILVCLLIAPAAFAIIGSSDVAVTASDSPDPVAPDGNITYTVNVSNNGPDAAPSTNFNVILNGTLLWQSMTVPAGWTCPSLSIGHGGSFTCSNPSFAVGTAQFTIVLNAGKAQVGIIDTTLNQLFTINSSNGDPNNGNNAVTVQTAYVAPKSDIQVTASDSPDPVAPDGNITYTVNVTNGGPDAAANAKMSVILNNTLLWQSTTVPAGWTCPSLSVGHGASFTCSNPSLANGATSVFTVVLKAAQSQIGINNTTLNELFTVGNDNFDTNNANNAVTVQTAYATPHSDMQVTASDSPDPVAPDGNITYTVNVTNAGPDAAANAKMSVLLNNTLLWQSTIVPAGWTCPVLTVGHGASFTCSNPSLANGATSVFTVVLKAAKSQIGIIDTTLNELFSVGNDNADPNNANNTVTVQTAYVAPKSDIQVTASDSPDPVAPDGNITYTVNVTNAGPDAAANAVLSVVLNNTLLWQSMTVPAGWSCPSLSVGHGASFSCTNPSLANAATSQFSIVLKAAKSQIGINNTTLNEVFTVGNDNFDTNNANNAVTVQTAYVTPQANLSVAATDSPDPVVPGNNITYGITLTNAGLDAAANTHLTAVLQGSLRFQSILAPAGFSCTTPVVGANGTIDCVMASFAVGSVSFTLVAQLDPALLSGPGGNIPQTFATSSDAQDTVPANNSVTVSTNYTTPTANLALTKGDAPDPVASGANITYTLTLTNNGPDAATNVSLTDALPAAVTFQSIGAPAGFSCVTPAVDATGTITCANPSMANAATATFTVVVKVVAASGTVTNTAGVSSSTFDNVAGNNSATATTTITAVASADLSIGVATGATSVIPGGPLSYTITLHNGGPDAASGIVITDLLPPSLLFGSIVAPPGFTCSTPPAGSTGTITCNGATLANGGTATFTLNLTVAPNATGPISNSAGVTSATSDPNGGNSSGGAAAVPLAPSASIPALSEWALMALALLVAGVAVVRMR
jgi:uncharacterized repeat protein (TIGR01451 family)